MDEVIDRAVDRINGDAQYSAPVSSVGRGAVDDVVLRTSAAEPAIRPRHVDNAAAVHCCRRQTRAAQAASLTTARCVGDAHGSIPARATIGRDVRAHAAVKVGITHDDRTIGQHQRLAADTAILGRAPLGWTPSGAAVARRAHVQQITLAGAVPLGVAVAVERAIRPVVACDPVLIGVDA